MKLRRYVLAASAAYFLALSAQAADNPFYFGVKGGLMDPDAGGNDQALNVGALVGYKLFDNQNGALALEAEFTTTLVDGDVAGGGEWDVDTLAAFLAFRSAGDVYLKLKGGYADQDPSGGSVSSDSGFAAGFGVGWRTSKKAGFEIEYTKFDNLDFVSFGYHTHF
jgi:hypothetical protein